MPSTDTRLLVATATAATVAAAAAVAALLLPRDRLKRVYDLSRRRASTPGVGPAGAEAPADGDLEVVFITDIEGNWEYLMRFVELSDALKLVSLNADGSAVLELASGFHFIHGGDTTDKGGVVGGTVRVTKTLVALKKKYPTRVTLLLGNRDVNKLRLTSELAPSEMANLWGAPGPYWVPEAKRVSPLIYLRKLCAVELGVAEADVPDDALTAANTLPNRIKWMLKDTMGADGEFQRRQAELGLIKGAAVSDDETAQHFVDSMEAGGFFRELLRAGELAAIVRNNLFVHGGLVGSYAGGATVAYGHVPGHPHPIDSNARYWISELNAWLRKQLQEWEARPRWEASSAEAYDKGLRGGHELMNYVVPGSPPSVVMGRHLDGAGMPAALDLGLVHKLNRSGITRLVVGHTPHGNCPTVMKTLPEGMAGVEVVMVDTSYSEMSAADNRGAAISEVVLERGGGARVRGVLHDGTEIAYSLSSDVREPSELIGRLEPLTAGRAKSDRRFSKAVIKGTGDLLLCNVNGFKVAYETIKASDGATLFAEGATDAPPPLPVAVNRVFSSTGDEECIGLGRAFDAHRAEMVEHFFKQADLDGSGTISVDELRKVLVERPETAEFLKLVSGTGRKPPAPEMLLKAMDTDKDGIISLAEFYSYCKNHEENLDGTGAWPEGSALALAVSLTVMAVAGVRLLRRRAS